MGQCFAVLVEESNTVDSPSIYVASQIHSLILLDGDVHVSLPAAQECWGWLLLTGVGLDSQWVEKQHCLVPVTMVTFKKQRRMPSFQHKQEIHSPGIHEVMVR